MAAPDESSWPAAPNPEVWALVQSSPDPTVVIQDGWHVFANDRALKMYRARDLAELASKPAVEYMAPTLQTQALERMRLMAENGRPLDYVDEAIIRLDGTRCEIEAAGSPIAFGGRPAALVVMRDISARIASEAAREEAEERFRSAFIHAPVGMAVLDSAGAITEANPALATMFACPMGELLGSSVWGWIHPDDCGQSRARFGRLLDNVSTVETAELRIRRADDSIVWAHASTSAPRDRTGAPTSFVMQLQDTTARRSAEDQLKHRASRDQLTGLANRSLFTARLDDALAATSSRTGTPAVMFLDLDRFKVVNDSMGHGCGDELLVQVAQRLQASLRPEDTVARFGGDEFAILLEQVHTAEQARRTARRLQHSLERPIPIDGTDVYVNASIGISLAEPGSVASTMLRDADVAMYRAKATGGSGYVIYDEQMRSDYSKRMDIENGLYCALTRSELFLMYQPIIETNTGTMVGVEALLRWKRANGDVILPDEFIPIAEGTRLIVPIGVWILRQACGQLREWRAQHPDWAPLTMAVNVSSRQLATPELAEIVGDLVTQIHPDRLSLEITETAAAQIDDGAIRKLEELRDLGVGIAIDDLGTGHSSLARLRKLPIDVVKIDGQFIAGLATSEADRSLVLAIIAMAHALGLVTIAEGVQNEEQADILREARCFLSQGYLYGRPQLGHEIERTPERALPPPRRHANSAKATAALGTCAKCAQPRTTRSH